MDLKGHPLHPWLEPIWTLLAHHHRADLSASDLLIAWDSRKVNGFAADGFLIATQDSVDEWMRRQMRVHDQHQLGPSVVEYKSLDRGPRWRALPDVLDAANSISGTCLVTLIDQSLELKQREATRKMLTESNLGQRMQHKWKEIEFLRVLRVIIMLTWLLARLTKQGQRVRWLCDEDDILQSPKQKADVELLLRIFTEQAMLHSPGLMTYSHYRSGGIHNLIAEELVAIPDLAVGCVTDVLGLAQRGTSELGIVYPKPQNSREISKQELLAKWFWTREEHELARLAIIVRANGTAQFSTGVFNPLGAP